MIEWLLKWANNWFKLTPNQMIEWMNPMIELVKSLKQILKLMVSNDFV